MVIILMLILIILWVNLHILHFIWSCFSCFCLSYKLFLSYRCNKLRFFLSLLRLRVLVFAIYFYSMERKVWISFGWGGVRLGKSVNTYNFFLTFKIKLWDSKKKVGNKWSTLLLRNTVLWSVSESKMTIRKK